jgi:hypothetical protein
MPSDQLNASRHQLILLASSGRLEPLKALPGFSSKRRTRVSVSVPHYDQCRKARIAPLL